MWSHRSHDEQTKCGCFIASQDHTPISFGYNGFIRNIDDSILPRYRPEKYPYMIHAEANAIYNAVRQGKSLMGSIAYISGKPCIVCLQSLYQSGINKIYYTDWSSPRMIENQTDSFNEIIRLTNIEILYIPKTQLQGAFNDIFKSIKAM